jgi:hypothetical protein
MPTSSKQGQFRRVGGFLHWSTDGFGAFPLNARDSEGLGEVLLYMEI